MTPRRMPLAFTGNTGGLLFILAAMWYAGASQGNGAAYFLFFLLSSVVLVSVPRALMNLASLEVRAEPVKPAFAGQELAVTVEVMNSTKRLRRVVQVALARNEGMPQVIDEIAAGNSARTTLRFRAERRGEHEIGGIELESAHPLGFVKARRSVPVGQKYLVYPEPKGDPRLPAMASAREGHAEVHVSHGDDFSGVRPYVLGESQRHIDWKAVARGQPMMTKQFASENDGALLFDFNAMPQKGVETRLAQIALWVVEAERAHCRYGVRLPSQEIPASLGEIHYHQCLRALALHS